MDLELKTLPCSYEGTMRYGLCAAAHPAKGTVLILPGWGEWIEKYTDIINEWNNRHFNVLILEWRGQGLSSRFLIDTKKAWLPSFDILIDDLDRLFKFELIETKKIILSCHSMGAHLGLRWYLERGRVYPGIKGVMLASMLHGFNSGNIPPCLARMIIRCAAFLGFDQAYAMGQSTFDQTGTAFADNILTHDEARYNAMLEQLRQNPTLKIGGLTYGWLNALLDSVERLETDLARGAPRIPYFVFGSNKDPLVDTKGFAHVASMLPNCMIRFFEGAHHELSLEKDDVRNAVWSATDEFIGAIKF